MCEFIVSHCRNGVRTYLLDRFRLFGSFHPGSQGAICKSAAGSFHEQATGGTDSSGKIDL
jgi:hypothetical protein